jgi:hypothetical protein
MSFYYRPEGGPAIPQPVSFAMSGEARIKRISEFAKFSRENKTRKDSQQPRSLPGYLYSKCLWNRCTLRLNTTNPKTASASICGHSTAMPVPLRKMPRTISRK